MTLPTVSVVIPTYNRCDIVERTLHCLAAQNYPPDLLEVLVVDNSADETPHMVERVAREVSCTVRLLHRAEKLPAVKRNIGLREASGDIVLFMNDDLWFVPDAIGEHVRTHLAFSEPVAVLGRTIQSPQMESTPFIDAYDPFAYFELHDRDGEELRWWYFWSMNISLPRKEMLRRNLVFHEEWAEIGNEDVELGWRWVQAGNTIRYNSAAWGEHFHPHSLASACRLQAQIGRGMRDLEALVDDPDLLERFGIFDWSNSRRAVVRGLLRRTIFNAATVPLAQRWLESIDHNSRLSRWMYWKVLLHHTNKGYRTTAPRRPIATPTLPRVDDVRTSAMDLR